MRTSGIDDFRNRRFGRLVAKSWESKRSGIHWWCSCDCGNETLVSVSNLKRGWTVSCGCYKREVRDCQNGLSNDKLSGGRIHNAWVNMMRRCYSPSCGSYTRYGGRGIKVSVEFQDFQKFYKIMAPLWFEGATLDRLNNNLGYSRANCRWLHKSKQSMYRACVVRGRINGELLSLNAAILKHGKVSWSVAKKRIEAGWRFADAVLREREGRYEFGNPA